MFYAKFVAFFLSAVAAVTLIFAIPSCKTLEDHGAAVQLIANQVAMRYVESKPVADRAATAARIVDIVHRIKAAAENSDSTLAELTNLAITYIPSNLTPADRALAVQLVAVLAQELKAKFGEGILKPDDRVRLSLVLDAVATGASVYAE